MKEHPLPILEKYFNLIATGTKTEDVFKVKDQENRPAVGDIFLFQEIAFRNPYDVPVDTGRSCRAKITGVHKLKPEYESVLPNMVSISFELLPERKPTESTTHELKCLPFYFKLVAEGIKTFEVRKNDRNFQQGDVLHLREYLPVAGYSGRCCCAEVTYILKGGDFGIIDGYCVLGIRLIH